MNVNEPQKIGTIMLQEKTQTFAPISISEKKDVSILSVTGGGMAESAGVVGTIFNKLKEDQVPVDLISTGVSEITFSVSKKHAKKARMALEKVWLEDKSVFEEITEQNELSHLALVGEGCVNSTNLSRAMERLSREEISPVALSCPQSRISISVIVKSTEAKKALSALHNEFFEERQ
jgi:aspartokinase/homoserine dehydrogenase 1